MTDYARIRPPRDIRVTRFHGQVNFVTHLGDGSDEIRYWECDHEHTSPDQASVCAHRHARTHTKDVR